MTIKTVVALASFNQVRKGDILAYSEELYGPALRAGYVKVAEVEGDVTQLDGDDSADSPDPAAADGAHVGGAKRKKASPKSAEVDSVEDHPEPGSGEPSLQG